MKKGLQTSSWSPSQDVTAFFHSNMWDNPRIYVQRNLAAHDKKVLTFGMSTCSRSSISGTASSSFFILSSMPSRTGLLPSPAPQRNKHVPAPEVHLLAPFFFWNSVQSRIRFYKLSHLKVNIPLTAEFSPTLEEHSDPEFLGVTHICHSIALKGTEQAIFRVVSMSRLLTRGHFCLSGMHYRHEESFLLHLILHLCTQAPSLHSCDIWIFTRSVKQYMFTV